MAKHARQLTARACVLFWCSVGGHPAATPVRLLPSPLRPAGQAGLQTPSPVRLGASSFFATPGFFPGTPVTEAMAAASWLQDLTARSPTEARIPPVYVLPYHTFTFDIGLDIISSQVRYL